MLLLLERLQLLLVPVGSLWVILTCGLMVVTVGNRELLLLLHSSQCPDALDLSKAGMNKTANKQTKNYNQNLKKTGTKDKQENCMRHLWVTIRSHSRSIKENKRNLQF